MFLEWFRGFRKNVNERPLLLLCDNHWTHISLNVIQEAIRNKVSLIKLPSHTTDRLQPLDVSCMWSLKSNWDVQLIRHQRKNNFRIVTKSEAVDLLCEIWKNTIKAGFMKTGIFPCDRFKYPTHVFDSVKLTSYQTSKQPLVLSPIATSSQFQIPTSSQSTAPLSISTNENSGVIPTPSLKESLHEVI